VLRRDVHSGAVMFSTTVSCNICGCGVTRCILLEHEAVLGIWFTAFRDCSVIVLEFETLKKPINPAIYSGRMDISHTYLLPPSNGILLEKLTGSRLVKKFTAFCGTRRFITAFTSARYLSLSRARFIQSSPHFPAS
jgi:hypothetical protein